MSQFKKLLIGVPILLFIIVSCDKNDTFSSADTLELITSYNVDVIEPSGLAVNSSGNILYTVSDNTNKIYKLTTTGSIIQSYSYVGNDLEGVSLYTDNKLLVAEERTKEIVVFDMTTNQTVKHEIAYENNDENSGLEGVTYDADDNSIFILNEKSPGLLIELNSNFSMASETELNFAVDFSGIFYESLNKNLWIVSDQSRSVYKCDLKGRVLENYPINVSKAEGIAVTIDKIYIISD
ncbi:MAG: SdiA-regulated domain-containing protein [Flavobacteriaceae bacterium]|nr:SdiA-regulated domain-containing protein [Flavobacteriaceae bacterium]